jgi:hypothetical protein
MNQLRRHSQTQSTTSLEGVERRGHGKGAIKGAIVDGLVKRCQGETERRGILSPIQAKNAPLSQFTPVAVIPGLTLVAPDFDDWQKCGGVWSFVAVMVTKR